MTMNTRYQNNRGRCQQQGFTLIEIMVVLVIIGLLIGLVGPRVFDVLAGANTTKVFADFDSIETALTRYRIDNQIFPTSDQGLRALVERPTMDPLPRKYPQDGYIERVPKDPWGRDYLYLNPGEHGRFDVFTLGQDGVRGGEDENRDLGNWESLNELDSGQ